MSEGIEYKEFATAGACAKSAAIEFSKNRWRWAGAGVPSERDIVETLFEIERLSISRGGGRVETGRLVVKNGRFFHQVSSADVPTTG